MGFINFHILARMLNSPIGNLFSPKIFLINLISEFIFVFQQNNRVPTLRLKAINHFYLLSIKPNIIYAVIFFEATEKC